MLVQAADQPANPHQRGGDLSQAALPPAVAQAGARAARARAHRGGQTRRHQQRRRRVAGRAGQAAAAAERPGALHLQPARQPRAAAPFRRCGAVPRGRRLQPPLDAARRAYDGRKLTPMAFVERLEEMEGRGAFPSDWLYSSGIDDLAFSRSSWSPARWNMRAPLPLRCGLAAGLGMAALQLHCCWAYAAAAACTDSMNVASAAPQLFSFAVG